MKDNRPVNLNLTTVAFPITAIASILHRISAVASWGFLGVFLMYLGCALSSPEQFNEVKAALSDGCWIKLLLWLGLTAVAYHSVASLKHVIQDFGFFEDFAGGQLISWATLVLGGLLSVLAGVAICL
ncbi:MAG: succinate dehydrogenase, cytochrome b556 subunit [Pseudomonadota bacterium]